MCGCVHALLYSKIIFDLESENVLVKFKIMFGDRDIVMMVCDWVCLQHLYKMFLWRMFSHLRVDKYIIQFLYTFTVSHIL